MAAALYFIPKITTGTTTGVGVDAPGWTPPESSRRLIELMADTILPATDTPGATQVGVTDFIVHIVSDWYTPEQRGAFVVGLDKFVDQCRAQTGMAFAELSLEERRRLLEACDRHALSQPEHTPDMPPFFLAIKDLTIIGYCTSPAGSAALGYYGPIGASPADENLGCGSVWN